MANMLISTTIAILLLLLLLLLLLVITFLADIIVPDERSSQPVVRDRNRPELPPQPQHRRGGVLLEIQHRRLCNGIALQCQVYHG